MVLRYRAAAAIASGTTTGNANGGDPPGGKTGPKDKTQLQVWNNMPYIPITDEATVSATKNTDFFAPDPNSKANWQNNKLMESSADMDADALSELEFVVTVSGGEIFDAGKAFVKGVQVADEALDGIAQARVLGQSGEDAAGITGPKTAINVGGRTRFPDRLTRNFLDEVKNVKFQNLTGQLRDYLQYSQDNGLQMRLFTRPSTEFSGPLKQLILNGDILHIPLHGL